MIITQIDIKHYSCSGLHSQCEGIRHVKSLPFLSIVQATEGSYDISIDGGKALIQKQWNFHCSVICYANNHPSCQS